MTAALGSPFDVSGAAHLPNSAFRPEAGALAGLGSPGQAVTLLRLEGIAASAAHRAASLGKTLAPFGAVEMLRGRRLGCDLGFGPRRRSRSRPAARWARGRCGGSFVRRPPAARSARRWRAKPGAT